MAGKAFHLIYLPAEMGEGTHDTILDIIETDDANDVIMEVNANPGSIAMELDVRDSRELPFELSQLGF